jgi:hypothetical protein
MTLLGIGWTYVFPDKEFKLFGFKFNLSPGPFNIKEHTVIGLVFPRYSQSGSS